MDKANLKVGDTVHFTCSGKGRGGHYNVTAVVTKINTKNALLTESKNSYWPGTIWNWPIELLKSDEEYRAENARISALYKTGGIAAVMKELKK